MKKEKMTNAMVLQQFEYACFRLATNPGSKTVNERFNRFEDELAKRLGITDEELRKIKNEESL